MNDCTFANRIQKEIRQNQSKKAGCPAARQGAWRVAL